MARVFPIPFFLVVFLLGMKFLCAPSHAHAATAESDGNASLWKSIHDYEDKYAFDQYGPPMPQSRARFEGETKLYLDMIEYYDEAAEDEPDFTFVVDAYDVPVDVFRPEVIRPGEAQKESEDNPFGEDDPLPESVQSTSAYVEEIRPTFLPGGPLRQRSPSEIKLGDDQRGSLFSERPVAPVVPVAPAASPDLAAAVTPGKPDAKAGAIDAPKGPKPGSDEETLANLKAAVKQLGMERLNLDPTLHSKEAAPDKPAAPANAMQPPAMVTPQAVSPVVKAPAHAKAKKKTHAVKKRKTQRATKAPNSDDGIVTQEIPIEDTAPQAAPADEGENNN